MTGAPAPVDPEAVVAWGWPESARITGVSLLASELAPEPTTTPKASIAITATAAARGDRAASAAPALANGSERRAVPIGAGLPPAAREPRRAPAASAIRVSATAGGTGPRRAPQRTQ